VHLGTTHALSSNGAKRWDALAATGFYMSRPSAVASYSAKLLRLCCYSSSSPSLAGVAGILFRRTLYRTVRTENDAVTGLRAKHSVTVRALVKELAGVDQHGFALRETADRTNEL